jgi:hypothetical protein
MVDLTKVKSSDLWYVIGYIATDGNLSKDCRHINITSKDREHLYSIRKALYLKNKIGRKARSSEKEKKYSFLQFGDVKFYKYLLNLGLTTNKSLTLGSLDVDKLYFVDFLRGVIDGDGYIGSWMHRTNHHQQWSLKVCSASPVFINWLGGLIELYFGISGKAYREKGVDNKNSMYILKYGKLNARKIIGFIYYNGCLCLERKLIQAQLCLQPGNKVVNLADKPR